MLVLSTHIPFRLSLPSFLFTLTCRYHLRLTSHVPCSSSTPFHITHFPCAVAAIWPGPQFQLFAQVESSCIVTVIPPQFLSFSATCSLLSPISRPACRLTCPRAIPSVHHPPKIWTWNFSASQFHPLSTHRIRQELFTGSPKCDSHDDSAEPIPLAVNPKSESYQP